MKTSHLSIIVISIVAFSSSLAYAEQPLLDFYNNSKLVLVGKVISTSQVPTTNNSSQSQNQTKYDIQVQEYYKSPQSAKVITIYGYAKGIYFGGDPTFEVGDRVFLYLNQQNGYYQIQPHSFVLNNDCDARPMIPMPTLPFEPPPISTPAARGDIFSFETDTDSTGYFFKIGDKIHVNFVAENYMPVMKDVTLNFTIKTENDTKIVYNDTKHVIVPPCNGRVPVSWDFTPNYTGTYFVHENISGSVSLGNQVVLFNDPSLGSSFDVRENMAGGTIDRAPHLPSPLKQFKSGIKPEYVKCDSNLHLIIKAEDGSFACVTIETGKKLALRGWATTFGTGISTNDYYTKCDTLYPQSDTGVAVLYMPTNSIGKICVQYHNLNNTPTGIGMRIFEANNLTQNASDVTAWTSDSTLEGNANKTIVYFIKTGTKAGFYGASLNCGGFPLAVGYDANSTITANDFPWIGQAFHCGVITYDSHIEGTAGIGVKYIPYP